MLLTSKLFKMDPSYHVSINWKLCDIKLVNMKLFCNNIISNHLTIFQTLGLVSQQTGHVVARQFAAGGETFKGFGLNSTDEARTNQSLPNLRFQGPESGTCFKVWILMSSCQSHQHFTRRSLKCKKYCQVVSLFYTFGICAHKSFA